MLLTQNLWEWGDKDTRDTDAQQRNCMRCRTQTPEMQMPEMLDAEMTKTQTPEMDTKTGARVEPGDDGETMSDDNETKR
ncbi:hypothetical protein SESBI_02935 [Sesbania bispinosa]|nr:hypothetical protein SESBI_02935 [Sesbania bispinosa]